MDVLFVVIADESDADGTVLGGLTSGDFAG